MALVLLEETPACHCVVFAEIEHGAASIAFDVVVAILIFGEWLVRAEFAVHWNSIRVGNFLAMFCGVILASIGSLQTSIVEPSLNVLHIAIESTVLVLSHHTDTAVLSLKLFLKLQTVNKVSLSYS
jgi:hypothetical protein